MNNILITGATGNIGKELIEYLLKISTQSNIVAGLRDTTESKKVLSKYTELHFVHFDFEDNNTHRYALRNIDTIFLLRPPNLSDVDKIFKPLLVTAKKEGVQKIIFLSVQGVETSKVIPHNKIERLIKTLGFEYIFVRPGYFMQNLTTTLVNDIKTKRQIILPAGSACFNWVDVNNVAEATAHLIHKFSEYKNEGYDITGTEVENFYTVAEKLSETTNTTISYTNINPISFYILKKKEGLKSGLIIVMILLHFLPRFQRKQPLSDIYFKLTGKNPTSLKVFCEREKDKFI